MSVAQIALVAAGAVILAVVWPTRRPARPAVATAAPPSVAQHRTAIDVVLASATRFVAVEVSTGRHRLLLDTPAPPPAGVEGTDNVWTVTGGDDDTIIRAVLDVPFRVGATREGALYLDLAAIGTLTVEAPTAAVSAHAATEAAQWGWEAATANERDGVINLTRHNASPDAPLIVIADHGVIEQLPPLPATAVIVCGEIRTTGSDDGGWHLTCTEDGAWILAPLDLEVTLHLTRTPPTRSRSDADDLAVPDTSTAPQPRVHLLGRVDVTGIASQRRQPKVLEVIAYLASHPAGATEHDLRTALWTEPPSRGRFNNTIGAARKLLGNARDGTLLLPHHHGGKYTLHPALTSDLDALRRIDVDFEGALDALENIDGRPYTANSGYAWTQQQGLTDDAADLVRSATVNVVDRLITRGEPERAASVARRALLAIPLDPKITCAHRDARLAAGDADSARRIEDDYRSATGRRLNTPAADPR